jgi:ketosteroid isomerase-like protein
MSEQNVEIVRDYYRRLDEAFDAYRANQVTPLSESPEANEVIGRLHPDVVWKPSRGDEYRGHDGVRHALEDWADAFGDDWRLMVEDLVDAGDNRVLATFHLHLRGKGSGVPINQRIYTILTVRGGRITLIDDFANREDAVRAAGLSE